MKKLKDIISGVKENYYYDYDGEIYSLQNGVIKLLSGDKHGRYTVMSIEGKSIGFCKNTFLNYITTQYIENEEWHTIKSFPNYMVSNMGRVRSHKFAMPKILKEHIDRHGYSSVCLYNENYQTRVFIHKLVAQEFIPNTNNHDTINHINHDKQDNRKENLEWVSREYNVLDGLMFRYKMGIYA